MPHANVDELHARGFTTIEGFVSGDELADARDALWLHYPRPEDYHADPSRFPELHGSQFAGLHDGCTRSWALNRLTTFLLLSDVTEADGPTKVIPYDVGVDVPYWPNHLDMGDSFADEVTITGPAGTLFAYHTDILHRGSQMTGEGASRFALLTDYQVWGDRWTARSKWPVSARNKQQVELLERASLRQRALFGFPAPGHPYWDDQTIADVGKRYPRMDMTPYRRVR